MSFNLDEFWIANNGKNEVITCKNRITKLFENGYHFEACVAQAAVLEGLLIQRLLLASNDIRGDRDKFLKRVNSKTLGGLHALAKKHRCLDLALLTTLFAYKESRNFLTHHYIQGQEDFDYYRFIEQGNCMIGMLYESLIIANRDKV